MISFSATARKSCEGVSLAARRLEHFVDGLLPASERARGALICGLLMGFYMAFNAWAVRVAGPIDFPAYYLAAAAFLKGQIPYGLSRAEYHAFGVQLMGIERFAYPYFYPPLTAALVAPLTLLPVAVAAWIWSVANAAAVVAGTALLLGKARWKAESLLAWGIVALFGPTLLALYTGQVAGIFYLTIAFAIHASERDQPMRAGAAIAAGALIKVTPVVLIGYLLWRGDWRAVAGAVLGALVIVLATLPIAGIDGWVQFFTVGLGTLHQGDSLMYPPNFTLNGMFMRSLSENIWTMPLAILPGLAFPLWIGSAFAVVALTIAACWPPFRTVGSVRLEIAVILVALQLIAPFTWYHQLTMSLLPACIVVVTAWRSGRLGSCWLSGLLAVVLLVDLYGVAWHTVWSSPLLLAAPLLAVVALWAALGVWAARVRRAA